MIREVPEVIAQIVADIRARMDVAVVGMSGGVDSSVVTALCVKALGATKVNGIHMPYSKLDEQLFNSRSLKLAAHLGVNSITVPITDIADSVMKTLHKIGVPPSKMVQGNIRSRSRMMALYALSGYWNEAGSSRVRVVGTGNLSEDFIGYDTKGGDALADFFPIGELFKSEVYQLAEALGIPDELIDRTPSAGLWDGQTDEGELGYSYNEMEPIIKDMLKFGDDYASLVVDADERSDLLYQFILDRRNANKHKHEAPPVCLGLRVFCD